jgi:hypothetical protein
MWAGGIVHEVIRESLNRYAHKQTPILAAELQAHARQKLRQGWTEAVNRDWEKRPKKTNLEPLYYGNGKTLPRERTEATRDRVYACLAAFAESDLVREILTVPYVNWKTVDTIESFLLDDADGLKVWCAIDFAFVDPAGRVRILDWKTGSEDKSAIEVQLGCYAFYASRQWYVPPDRLTVEGVYLRDGARVVPYAVSAEVLIAAKDTILTSAATMRGLLSDVRANTAREDDFAFCDDDRRCARCNYRAVCPRVADAAPASAPDREPAP